MLYSVFMLALRSVQRNMLRSLLTILGIVIGVSAVITMVMLGNGATREIGLRLAVGALEGQVLLQFLIVAVVLSVVAYRCSPRPTRWLHGPAECSDVRQSQPLQQYLEQILGIHRLGDEVIHARCKAGFAVFIEGIGRGKGVRPAVADVPIYGIW